MTFDLGVSTTAFNILSQNQRKFENVIIRIGVFHTISSVFAVFGKHMKGSGFEDIVIEASVCSSGSLQNVLSEKHYNRELRVHKMTLEALERFLYKAFTAHYLFVGEMNFESKVLERSWLKSQILNVSKV